MTLADQIRRWRGEHVVLHYDAAAEAWIVVALHSSVLGPATGGTRMRTYPDLEHAVADALALSAGMTLKYAVGSFPRGGGKAVIYPTRVLSDKERARLLERYGRILKELAGLFWTGPDVGTSSSDMDIIARTGAPFVFSRTQEGGGAGSSGPYTALGVFTAIQVACDRLFDGGLRGRTVLVQGVGSVGATLAEHLVDAGAHVLVCDVNAEASARIPHASGVVAPEAVYDTACDVFAPCALGGALTQDNAPMLRCRLVAGGANNQLASPAVAEQLAERGVVYIPDFAINVGGAMAITGIEAMGWTRDEAARRVVSSVRAAVEGILDGSASGQRSTEAAARELAEANLRLAADSSAADSSAADSSAADSSAADSSAADSSAAGSSAADSSAAGSSAAG